jgi:hypothetical protein
MADFRPLEFHPDSIFLKTGLATGINGLANPRAGLWPSPAWDAAQLVAARRQLETGAGTALKLLSIIGNCSGASHSRKPLELDSFHPLI